MELNWVGRGLRWDGDFSLYTLFSFEFQIMKSNSIFKNKFKRIWKAWKQYRQPNSLGPHSFRAGFFSVFIRSSDTSSVHTPARGGAIALLGFKKPILITVWIVEPIIILDSIFRFCSSPRLWVRHFCLHHQTFGSHCKESLMSNWKITAVLGLRKKNVNSKLPRTKITVGLCSTVTF